MPIELVGGAIAYAESEPGIVSVAGWVVEALRKHRDEGWRIPQPRKRANPETPIDVEHYIGGEYGDLFRRGSDLSDRDDADRELVQPGGQSSAQALAPDLVPPGAGVAAQGAVQLSVEPTPAEVAQADELEVAEDQLRERAAGDADRTALVRVWNRVLASMQVQLSRHEFNTWVRHTELRSFADGVITISAPSALVKEGFENRYTGLVRGLIRDLYAPVKCVRVVVAEVGGHGLPSAQPDSLLARENRESATASHQVRQ
jgi:DnaA-like protein